MCRPRAAEAALRATSTTVTRRVARPRHARDATTAGREARTSPATRLQAVVGRAHPVEGAEIVGSGPSTRRFLLPRRGACVTGDDLALDTREVVRRRG
ncbi:hypothetical protein BIU96_17540 [Curtobacterium sp. MCBA15_008]|nr:hypothetical protein BIU96_17540 [Curtobacterium sp. MCBA15_008]